MSIAQINAKNFWTGFETMTIAIFGCGTYLRADDRDYE